MIKRSVVARLTEVRFIRFLFVGIVNAIFGYGCIWVFLTIGCDYRLALLFGTITGVLFNFKTTGKVVFRSSDNRRIVRFLMVYAVVYGANVAMVRGLALLGIDLKLGSALAVLPMAIFGYILNRRFVFNVPVSLLPD